MTPENFCYWLQGKFELDGEGNVTGFTKEQAEVIHEHLQLVFTKVTGKKQLKDITATCDANELGNHLKEVFANRPTVKCSSKDDAYC